MHPAASHTPFESAAPAAQFTVVDCSYDDALSNCLIVHQSDFAPGQHVLVGSNKGQLAMTTEQGTVISGHVGMNIAQEDALGVMKNDTVWIGILDAIPKNVASVTLDIQPWSPDSRSEERLPIVDLSKNLLSSFSNKIVQEGQILVFVFNNSGSGLQATVKNLIVSGERPSSKMGIMTLDTTVTLSSADSRIKFEESLPNNVKLARGYSFDTELLIGGLEDQITSIIRRALASRMAPEEAKMLGIQHVKGILLFGPPGTGKTLIARQMSKLLSPHEPKIISGPEVLDKFVGNAEKNIRKLFEPAEKEYKEKGDASELHIIIFDEMDAILRPRQSNEGGSHGGENIVNQLLAKMDGVDQINNVIIFGMTNRIDLIDEALLRPGRFEVKLEIPLPKEQGRKKILDIHTKTMSKNKRLDPSINTEELSKRTKNFTGAELAGLVRSAASFALNANVGDSNSTGTGTPGEPVRVNNDHFASALKEIHPAFGASEEELNRYIQHNILEFDSTVKKILREARDSVNQVKNGSPLVTLLLHGPPGSGKSALAARIAKDSQFPLIKLLSPNAMVGLGDKGKIDLLNKTFLDSYKSSLSIIVIDDIERILGWVNVGPMFSNGVLQTLLVLLKRIPPSGKHLHVIMTTSIRTELDSLQFLDVVNEEIEVRALDSLKSIKSVLKSSELMSDDSLERVLGPLKECEGKFSIGIKKLLYVAKKARNCGEAEVVGMLKAALCGPAIQTSVEQ